MSLMGNPQFRKALATQLPVPGPTEAEQTERERAQKKSRRLARGRQSTLLTEGQGVRSSGTLISRKTLLGQ
jgi:hypothetical protein